jgi:hypothetical protein
MKVTTDRDRYDELQAALVGRIADAVRGHVRLLLEGRVAPDLAEITNDIVFAVTSILDGADGDAGPPACRCSRLRPARRAMNSSLRIRVRGPGCTSMCGGRGCPESQVQLARGARVGGKAVRRGTV